MSTEKHKQFIINVSYFLIIIGIAYIVIKYLLGLVTPFLVGFVVALCCRR